MMAVRPGLAVLFALVAVLVTGTPADDTKLVQEHVKDQANKTFREPSGVLKYKYLVPAGPYNQLWDWDSFLLGSALLPYGSAPYLEGSMLNFLSHTNLTTGAVRGCLTPDGAPATIYHAKPVIIQAAFLVAQHTNNYDVFKPFEPAMEALLRYWTTSSLPTWHDQLESGADNLVLSRCPSAYSPGCWTPSQANTLASPDLMVWLHRELTAYAAFQSQWKSTDAAYTPLVSLEALHQRTQQLHSQLDSLMWSGTLGHYVGYNTSTATQITNRVFLLAFPLFAGLANATQASLSLQQLTKQDMASAFGLRSTASSDPRYSNVNEIVPYSNWRGPVWINANVLLSYGLAEYGQRSYAQSLADTVVGVLADDLRATGTWHECYSSANGSGLAAPGFLSWDTLGATWQANLKNGVNPFALPSMASLLPRTVPTTSVE